MRIGIRGRSISGEGGGGKYAYIRINSLVHMIKQLCPRIMVLTIACEIKLKFSCSDEKIAVKCDKLRPCLAEICFLVRIDFYRSIN